MSPSNRFTHVVKQVARGERPVADLALIGVRMKSGRMEYATRHEPFAASGQSATISVEDVAAGLLAHHEDSEALQAWGTALLVLDVFDVSEEFETHEDFDVIWGAVWDATFEGKVTGDAISRARRLTPSTDEMP